MVVYGKILYCVVPRIYSLNYLRASGELVELTDSVRRVGRVCVNRGRVPAMFDVKVGNRESSSNALDLSDDRVASANSAKFADNGSEKVLKGPMRGQNTGQLRCRAELTKTAVLFTFLFLHHHDLNRTTLFLKKEQISSGTFRLKSEVRPCKQTF